MAEATNGAAEGVAGAAARAEADEIGPDFGQSEGSPNIGVVDLKMRSQRGRGLGSLRLETEDEGGRINLARARHFAAYFAQLIAGVNVPVKP
jgi:hypothetical protein